jgi:DNA-binding transcriptional ArsR family regulator
MTNPDLVGLAGAIADASRAAMLDALMDGRAHSIGELAKRAHVTAPTASEHVARLVGAKLARVPGLERARAASCRPTRCGDREHRVRRALDRARA